jgi:alpha-tubulin suppressor-like RCC1 family protein
MTGAFAVCWGDNTFGQSITWGTVQSVSAGYFHTCGVRTDRTIVCWGVDTYGQASMPPGI